MLRASCILLRRATWAPAARRALLHAKVPRQSIVARTRSLCSAAKANVEGTPPLVQAAIKAAKADSGLSLSTVATAGAAIVGVGVLVKSIRVVPANHVGIYDLFGVVDQETKGSGLHVINPLATLHDLSCKTSTLEFDSVVPSKEGLNVQVQFSVQYHLDKSMAVELYRTVGLDYETKLMAPQVKAAVRKATSTRDAKALYTAEREQVKADLLAELNAVLNPRGILIEDVPLKQIVLPSNLAAAIESKLQMEQESQRMDFVLAKEAQEAERKRIEAQGIADFQRIVSNGIDDRLLRWKGIEATVELARSQNAKVVVVGQGKDGLPLILGGGQK